MDYEKVKLDNINAGAAMDLFEAELQKALVNIADENTSPTATREIKLVVKIKPGKDRQSAGTEIQCTSKLAPYQPHESFMIFGHDGDGKVEAYQTDINQPQLPGIGDENITNITEGANR